VRGCVKSPTSDKCWSDNVFIKGGNHHLISRFCGVVLSPTTISKNEGIGNLQGFLDGEAPQRCHP